VRPADFGIVLPSQRHRRERRFAGGRCMPAAPDRRRVVGDKYFTYVMALEKDKASRTVLRRRAD